MMLRRSSVAAVSGLNQLQLLESRAGPNRVKPAATPAKPANEDAAAAVGSAVSDDREC